MAISANKQQTQSLSSTEFVIQSVNDVVDVLTFEKFKELFKDELLQLEQYHNKWSTILKLIDQRFDVNLTITKKHLNINVKSSFDVIKIPFGLSVNNGMIFTENNMPMFCTDVNIDLGLKSTYSGINGNVVKYLFGLISYDDVCSKIYKSLLSKVKNTLKKAMTGKPDIAKILTGKLDSRFFTVDQIVASLMVAPGRLLNLKHKELKNVLPNYLEVMIALLPKFGGDTLRNDYLFNIVQHWNDLTTNQQNQFIDNGYLLEYLIEYGENKSVNGYIPEFDKDKISNQALNHLRGLGVVKENVKINIGVNFRNELGVGYYPFQDHIRLTNIEKIQPYLKFLVASDREQVHVLYTYFSRSLKGDFRKINYYGDRFLMANEFYTIEDSFIMLPDLHTYLSDTFSKFNNQKYIGFVDPNNKELEMLLSWFDLIKLTDLEIEKLHMYFVFITDTIKKDHINRVKDKLYKLASKNLDRVHNLIIQHWDAFMPNIELDKQRLLNFFKNIKIELRVFEPIEPYNNIQALDNLVVLDFK